MHSHPYHRDVLQALYASPDLRIDGLRTLATRVAGLQPSPNADIDVARDLAVAAEILALRGLITIDRATSRASFSLTPLGQASMRPPAKQTAVTLSGAVVLTTALNGCTSILAPAAVPATATPSLEELRQRAPSRIEQVVDPYHGHAFFARCTDCASPTPKTLATAPAAITQFIPADVLARAVAADVSATSAPVQRQQTSQPAESTPEFVERRYVVFFKFAEGGVDPAAQLALQRVASQLSGAKSILIVGSTDPSGSAGVNQRLAERRAQSLSAALSRSGVSSSIQTQAKPNRAAGLAEAVVLGRAAAQTPAARARHAEIVVLVPVNDPRVASLSK